MRIPHEPPDITKILSEEDNRSKIIEYFQREDVKEFVTNVNTKYLYWDEVRHRPVPTDTTHRLLWTLIRLIRNYDMKIIKISDINIFTFRYKLTDHTSQKLHEFDLNLGGSLESGSLIPSEDRDKYLVSSIMEEAIASSQLEGAATTRKVAKEMLRTDKEPKTKSERMILNNYITIKKILDLVGEKLTPEMILDIHSSMTNRTLPVKESEGRFRESNDVVVKERSSGKIVYIPPNYELIPKLIEDLCVFANKSPHDEFIHPIVKATMLHFLVGYIHPFVDGNGRTARAIFYWYMLNHGYWLFEFMSISRTIIKSPAQYARAYLYTEKDENDLTYFINYQIKTIDHALKDLKTYINRQVKKKSENGFYKLLKIEGINNRQVYLLREFSENPEKMITINEVKNIFNIVYQTARTDLLRLVELGFLEVKRSERRKLLFFRSENFEKLLDERIGQE